MQTPQADINSFIAELAAIPFSDPLVDLSASRSRLLSVEEAGNPFALQADNLLNSILRTAATNKKDADLNTLCISIGSIGWTYREKAILSPLVLIPVLSSKSKASADIKIIPQAEMAFLNPFLKHSVFSGLSFEDLSPDEMLEKITAYCSSYPEIQLSTNCFLGNFHHHRYALLREMETLAATEKLSPLVETLLGNESATEENELPFSNYFLTPADPDQRKIFTLAGKENLVIQGPPGTGKSQVLTNLIGKRLPFEGMTLVVSEKKSALDVLISKLKKAGLGHLGFLAHSQVKPKDFITALRANWKLFEDNDFPEERNIFLSEQLHDQLQLLLSKLNSPGLAGGISYSEFRKAGNYGTGEYSSAVPDLKEWLKFSSELKEIESLIVRDGVFTKYKKELLVHPNADRILEEIQFELKFFSSELKIVTVSGLDDLLKIASRIQLLENEAVKSWFHLYKNEKEQKQFNKLRQRFTLLSEEIALQKNELKIWKTLPAKTQVESWIREFDGKLSWTKNRKLRKAKIGFLKADVDFLIACKNLLSFLQLEEEMFVLKTKFQKLGIENPQSELEAAGYVIEKLANEDLNELNTVIGLSASEKQRIRGNESRVKNLVLLLKKYVVLTDDPETKSIINGKTDFAFISFRNELNKLPSSFFTVLSMVSSPDAANALVFHSNWLKTLSDFPELRNYEPQKIKEMLNEILAYEEEEFQFFSRQIKHERKQQFEKYAEILRTPSAKLSHDHKSLKKQLKSGKSILVKEFAKSKQHLSIRQLFSSDARIWIELLTPVWLSTPSQMATFFPMEKDLFDLVIFDEASQIPLPNALGSLQRSKRAIVAGDSQQMSPSNYFSGVKSSADLLHQAGFYWKNTALKHHYRSVHPELIAFSNKHFYKNELIAFPSPGAKFPLHRHYVENGIFADRVNKNEAKELAEFLEKQSWNEHIGITAFSGQQLDEIWNACSEKVKAAISDGIEKGAVFFKALESVQGDECDVLLISMGYGKNEAGDFHMRFGPLNQANGHKRLNVLLTRARKELHFFTSVMAEEIPLSRNESVNLLRSFILHLENYGQSSAAAGSFTNKLEFFNVHELMPDSRELSTYYRVMKERGWKVSFS